MADPNPPLMSLTGIMSFFSQKGLLKIREVGKNKAFSDALFQKMLKDVGWNSGEAWCAALVKAVYIQCFPFDKDWLLKKFGKGAYQNFKNVQLYNSQGDKKYIAIKTATPQVGDIACWQNGTSAQGHTGIVTEVISNVKVKCVEGNTSMAGVREGEGIFELTRNVGIGDKLGGLIFRGYIRRNFTEQETKELTWDEENLCYGLKKQSTSVVTGAMSASVTQLRDYFKTN